MLLMGARRSSVYNNGRTDRENTHKTINKKTSTRRYKLCLYCWMIKLVLLLTLFIHYIVAFKWLYIVIYDKSEYLCISILHIYNLNVSINKPLATDIWSTSISEMDILHLSSSATARNYYTQWCVIAALSSYTCCSSLHKCSGLL